MAESEKLSLETKRFIRASRDRVYAAWTDPAQLRQWFGPENVETRNLIADVRVGGQFRWELTDPEGKEMTISGEYREVHPGKKIVFTWQLQEAEDWKNHSSIVTVEFFDRRGRYGDPPDSRKTSKRSVTRRSHTRLEQCTG